jgi:hypothetical protein
MTLGKIMKALPLIAGWLILVVASFGAEFDSWLSEPPPEAFLRKHPVVSERDFYEVVASMRGNSESELRKKAFIPITEDQAKKYVGVHFACPAGKRPFLVRALYAFAGTGRFSLSKFERGLVVIHESLGSEFVTFRSALVVNLDSEPSHLYVSVSVAQ